VYHGRIAGKIASLQWLNKEPPLNKESLMERLKTWTPVLLILVLGTQLVTLYLSWSAEDKAQRAGQEAWQASNYALQAATSSRQLTGLPQKAQLIQQQCSQCSSAVRTARSHQRSFRAAYGNLLYAATYHEVLLEDLARKTGVDLEATREAAVTAAKRAGRVKPPGWRWVRRPRRKTP
jgi:hypothetical protein